MNHLIRIGFWNILNYTGVKDSAREYLFAHGIKHNNIDIITLAEVKTKSDNNNIVEQLNKLDKNNKWSHITTKLLGKPNHQERYMFLYKSNRFSTVKHPNEKKLYLVSNKELLKKYTRPVLALTFKDNINNEIFTISIAHFDPKGECNIIEAQNLDKVLDDIEKRIGANKNIIFLGDTNIKSGSHDIVFEDTLKKYQNVIDPSKKTTLSNQPNTYANSYDKIFYKGDLKIRKGKVYDLWKVFNNVSLKTYKKKLKDDNKHLKNINFKREVYKISDHTLIYCDLEVKNKNTTNLNPNTKK